MLPPMAIFFPLFTLLEDFGYLPRVAFNLDRCFKKCSACGKQALTMCMGFGCNAAGVTGCRIIDSPRERLIAIITNNFVPCNGRFPTIISIITLFLIGGAGGFYGSFLGACILVGIIILGRFYDSSGFQAAVSHSVEGSPILLHPGDASLPETADTKGNYKKHCRSYYKGPRARHGICCSCRPDHLDPGQRASG